MSAQFLIGFFAFTSITIDEVLSSATGAKSASV
jgi:hypothetical protein